MVLLKKVFLALLLTTSLCVQSFAQEIPENWNNWYVNAEDSIELRLAYFKFLSHLKETSSVAEAASFSQRFLSLSDFRQKLAQIPAGTSKTLSNIIAHLTHKEIDKKMPPTVMDEEAILAELLVELKNWSNRLSSSSKTRPLIRLEIAINYAKALAENRVSAVLLTNTKLHEALLLPLAEILKNDQSSSLRQALLDPILAHGVFNGTAFEQDLLEMAVMDNNSQVQLKLLEFFKRDERISFEKLKPILEQIVAEDAKRIVRETAQSILTQKDIGTAIFRATRPRGAIPKSRLRFESLSAKSIDHVYNVDGFLAAPEAEAASPEEAEPQRKKTKRIKKSTVILRKSTEILKKIEHLQNDILDQDLAISVDHDLLTGDHAQAALFLKQIILSKAHLYIRTSALELLFYLDTDITGILEGILVLKSIPDELKISILNKIKLDLPVELVPVVRTMMVEEYYGMDPMGRRLAIEALQHCRDPLVAADAADQLVKIATNDKSPSVRAEAVKALSKLTGEAAIKPLGEILQDTGQDAWVRWKAYDALEAISYQPEAMKVLQETAKQDPITNVRIRIADLFREKGIAVPVEVSTLSNAKRIAEVASTDILDTDFDLFIDIATSVLLINISEQNGLWNSHAAVDALQTTYEDHHRVLNNMSAYDWLTRLNNEGILESFVTLQNPTFNNLRPLMELAIRQARRLGLTPPCENILENGSI